MEELLRARQVMALLQISLRTLRRLTSEGKVEFIRVGRSIRFSPSAVERYIEENKNDVRANGTGTEGNPRTASAEGAKTEENEKSRA